MKNAADCRGEQSTALQAFGAERSNLFFSEERANFAWLILAMGLLTLVIAFPAACVVIISQFQ